MNTLCAACKGPIVPGQCVILTEDSEPRQCQGNGPQPVDVIEAS